MASADTDLTDTQEQILDAALSCIVRDGLDGASMRSVAREADVSLGLLSYHFDDKWSLIEAAFQLATDRLYEATIASLDGIDDPDERVRAYIRGAFHGEFLEDDYLALRIALWAMARTDNDLARVEESLYGRYADRLVELICAARPGMTEREATERATDVIIVQNGLWLDWARHHRRADLERGLARCDETALANSAR